MKFTVTLKDPDGVYDSLRELPEEAKELAMDWLEWGEYITVEFDTETKTATVVRP